MSPQQGGKASAHFPRRICWRPVRRCPRSTTAPPLLTRGVMSDPLLSPMLLPELLNFSEENILEILWQVLKFSFFAPVSSLRIFRLPRRGLDEARNSGGGMKGDLRTLRISLRPTPWIFLWSVPPSFSTLLLQLPPFLLSVRPASATEDHEPAPISARLLLQV